MDRCRSDADASRAATRDRDILARSRSEQRNERRLWAPQTKCGGKIAVGGDLFDVLIPRFMGVSAQLLIRSAEQQVPGALNVLGSEGSAVMPLHTFAQPESQLTTVLVPRPVRREVRHDGLQTVLRLVLLVNDKIVGYSH